MVEEVEQGLITTDEQAWERMAELNASLDYDIVTPMAGYNNGILNNVAEMAAAVAAVDPIDAAKAKINANTAIQYTASSGYTGIEDGKADAYRHAFWNILMTRDIGASQAKEVADIHEKYNFSHQLAATMDDYNNAVGRGSYPSSGSTTDTALSNIIKSKMTAGTLVYIKNGELSFTNK
ncbi:hypothetical protein [Paenibacillus sp. ACRRY]|uniref:DUF6973 domain-containing protein n=1 Tax=Paenibacillus sp. ACRRY TaxID=2918208 RepID=UPI001EF47161|nr:hypothetical protein [Paenibacillus sp. ACRRY]MCG7381718.1 hypothetical protein [Paenibacillus sp. ACRRY]